MSTPNPPDYVGYAYGLLVATGGIVGFLKASSVPSLVAGTVSGGLIALGAHRYQHQRKPDLIFGMSLALTLLMGKRFLASKKVMPAGLTTTLSLAMAVRYGTKFLEKRA